MSDNSNFSTKGGNATLGQNIGVGSGVYGSKLGNTLRFKSICSSGNTLVLNEDSNHINFETQDFLRADIADVKTGGNLTFNDNIHATFGTNSDMCLFHSGGNAYLKNSSGNTYVRIGNNENAIQIVPNSCVELYYNNNPKLKSILSGSCTIGTHYSEGLDSDAFKLTDGNQQEGFILKSDATGVGSWQPSSDATALKVFYVDGNNTVDGDGGILNPYKSIDLAYSGVCGTGTAGAPQYEGVTVSIAGYEYTTAKNLWLSNTTYLFNPGAKLAYTGTDFLFKNQGLTDDTKKHEIKVLGNGEFSMAAGGFARVVGVDSSVTNGFGIGILAEVESITSSYVNAENPDFYNLFILENDGATAQNHFRRNLVINVKNFISSKSQTPFVVRNRGRLKHTGGLLSAGGSSSGDNHSQDLRLYKIQRSHLVEVFNVDWALRWGQYFVELGEDNIPTTTTTTTTTTSTTTTTVPTITLSWVGGSGDGSSSSAGIGTDNPTKEYYWNLVLSQALSVGQSIDLTFNYKLDNIGTVVVSDTSYDVSTGATTGTMGIGNIDSDAAIKNQTKTGSSVFTITSTIKDVRVKLITTIDGNTVDPATAESQITSITAVGNNVNVVLPATNTNPTQIVEVT